MPQPLLTESECAKIRRLKEQYNLSRQVLSRRFGVNPHLIDSVLKGTYTPKPDNAEAG